nr:MAG TPA: Integrase [Caudoviricetes sp.]
MQSNITTRKKDNAYQVIVSYKDGRKWRQKSKQGFRTQREAKEYGQQIIEALKTQITPIDENMRDITLGEFAEVFLREKVNLTYSTKAMYRVALKSFPMLTSTELRNINHNLVIRAFNEIHIAPSTMNLYLRVLKAIANYAIRPYKLIRENPFNSVPRRKESVKKVYTFTDEEMKFIFSSIDGYARVMVSIAYYAGCRIGEILGLTWEDIDLDGKTITINKQVTIVDSKKFGVTAPKTVNSYRTIPIPPILCEILREYKATQSDRLLFPKKNSKYVPRILKKLMPNKTFHDLRHTYATKLLANGVDIKTVASLLGDNVNTVIKVYVHYTDDMRMKAAENVANIFNKSF